MENDVVRKIKKSRHKTKIKKRYRNIPRPKEDEHYLALGFAIGTGIAILPTPGLGVVLGVIIALIWKKINKLALFGAMAIFNPFTIVLLYELSFKLGDIFFGSARIIVYNITILDQVIHFTKRFLVGNAIIAVVTAALCYFIIKYSVRIYRKKIGATRI